MLLSLDGDLRHIKGVLQKLGQLDIANCEIGPIKPFNHFASQHIQRWMDPVWADSLLSNKPDIEIETLPGVSFYAGHLYLRWTLPSAEIIEQCDSLEKLIHTGMIAIEELIHIRQAVSPNCVGLTYWGVDIELIKVQSVNDLPREDLLIVEQLKETDVAYFFRKAFDTSPPFHLWFDARSKAGDSHRILEPGEVMSKILTLAVKYGDPSAVLLELVEGINYLKSEGDPLGERMMDLLLDS